MLRAKIQNSFIVFVFYILTSRILQNLTILALLSVQVILSASQNATLPRNVWRTRNVVTTSVSN